MEQLDMFQSRPESKKDVRLLPDPYLFSDGLPEEEMMRWVDYLYANPRPTTKRLNLRDHVIGLYDPFACRKEFPAGRRWCVNVYVGCAYACKYCYITGYVKEPFKPRVKRAFRKLLRKDLEELDLLGLSPAPIHISNSCDPLQPLERLHKNTLFLLQQLQRHQQLFTTITMLTKNPTLLCSPEYLEVIRTLSAFQVEVTCPFSRDAPRKDLERGAPKIEDRLKSIGTLRENNVTVSLRMDPVFPRDPLPAAFFEKPTLAEYGAPENQTEEDIEYLIRFASEVGCSRIIVSPLKLTIGRFNESTLLPQYRELYKAANRGELIRKGSAFRMPWALYQYWIMRPLSLAHSLEVPLVYCKKSLFTTY